MIDGGSAGDRRRGAEVVLQEVSKRFGATQALASVDVTLGAGRIHALVGENGAGKSTLGKVVGGIYVPDSGVITIDGVTVAGRWHTARALGWGIVTIQQELSLVPYLTVVQNVFLGLEDARFGVLRRTMHGRYRELDERLGFGLDPDALVVDLRIADQQKVEIMRAVASDARLIIMDEPTSSLTRDEADLLHAIVRQLKREGRTIVYVSHFLDDVLDIADDVTVLRDGHLVRSEPAAGLTKDQLVESMLGRRIEHAFPQLPEVPDDAEEVLRLEAVSGAFPKDVSLNIRAGEIVGLAGLVGSGRTEVARLVAGADPLHGGRIVLDGEPLGALSPRAAIAAGIHMVPEDRRHLGLVLLQNVRENVTLPRLKDFSRMGLVRRSAERRTVRDAVQDLGVVPQDTEGDIAFYSGGNQQKVLFAKWTSELPRVLILDEPTRGVDVGAKRRIYDAIVEVAERGTAILLVSSELDELLALSHRLVLMTLGHEVGRMDAPGVTAEVVLRRLFESQSEVLR